MRSLCELQLQAELPACLASALLDSLPPPLPTASPLSPQGWRNELYPAVQTFHDEPAFLIERAAAPFFGIKAYGA